MKYVKVFGYKAYVLRTPRGTKFELRALKGVYLETLDYGVYRVLVTGHDGMPKLVDSRHMTFDESKFPGLFELGEHMSMDNEALSDDDVNTGNMSELLTSDPELVSTDNFNGGPSRIQPRRTAVMITKVTIQKMTMTEKVTTKMMTTTKMNTKMTMKTERTPLVRITTLCRLIHML